ncbi:MAG: hypothetical protein ACLTDF_07560 [Coprococcus sp.]
MMYKHYIKADAIYDDIIEYKESHVSTMSSLKYISQQGVALGQSSA